MALKIRLSNYHRRTENRGLAGWPSVAITALLSPKGCAEVTAISAVSPFSIPARLCCAAAEQRRKGEKQDVAKGRGGLQGTDGCASSQLSPQKAEKLFKEIWFAHSLNKLCVCVFFLSPLKVRSLEKLPVYLPPPLAYLDPLRERGGQAWVKS